MMSKGKSYYYVINPNQVINTSLPLTDPQSISNVDPSTFVYCAPIQATDDEYKVPDDITMEKIRRNVKILMKQTIEVHRPNAPILFTFFGWSRLAVQPRELLLANNVKCPMFQMTGEGGTGKSDL